MKFLIQSAQADAGASPGAAVFLEDLIDACVMESTFREHMAERDLLFHDTVAQTILSGSFPSDPQTGLSALLSLNAPSHPIRKRRLRLTAESPDLLAVIQAEGKVSTSAQSHEPRPHHPHAGRFDQLAQTHPEEPALEFWLARDLQEPLGYARWENFLTATRSTTHSYTRGASNPPPLRAPPFSRSMMAFGRNEGNSLVRCERSRTGLAHCAGVADPADLDVVGIVPPAGFVVVAQGAVLQCHLENPVQLGPEIAAGAPRIAADLGTPVRDLGHARRNHDIGGGTHVRIGDPVVVSIPIVEAHLRSQREFVAGHDPERTLTLAKLVRGGILHPYECNRIIGFRLAASMLGGGGGLPPLI